MGVSVFATNSIYSFDMGYGGFFNLRKNIAIVLDEEFGNHYANILFCHSTAEFDEHDEKAIEIINRKHLDEEYGDVLDFLYSDDGSGFISHRTCKKIYDLIKDIDFGDKHFRYAAYAHNDWNEFKEFLKECYSHHKKMRWN